MSNATDGSIKYEPSLVQALFLHVIETGLQDEAVRTELRPLLEVASVTDEQLMEKVNRIMLTEVEHQNKMGVTGRKAVRVNQIETASPPGNRTEVLIKHPRVRVVSPRNRNQSQIHWRQHWKQCSQILHH